MENKDTEYKEGDDSEFLDFLFTGDPKEINSIKLELGPAKPDVKIALHIFQELLMIFTGGLKKLFGRDETVDITILEPKDIQLIDRYFKSMGFQCLVEKFTISEYIKNMKLPNYFLKQELITDTTPLPDIYYETTINYIIYRVSFDFMRV
jgi:hypothetical protein